MNESLCALNLACFEKLTRFNELAGSPTFDTRIQTEYKNGLLKSLTDNLIVDTYSGDPAIRVQISTLLERIKSTPFKTMDEMHAYFIAGMGRIRDEKLKGLSRDDYAHAVAGQENARSLEYITYDSLVNNAPYLIKILSYRIKKNAILEFCSQSVASECTSVKSLKADLDDFKSRRVPLPAGQEPPVR